MKQKFINKNNCTLNKQKISNDNLVDVVLIGAGIMSATLAILLKKLEPNWTIYVYERLKEVAKESSNPWNNAGTGHAAFCELNYTKQNLDGSIDISNAIAISESFEMSLQFWSYLVKKNILNNPKLFINNIPHISLVWGNKNISFLRKRFQTLYKNNLFSNMEYSEDLKQIYDWIPLIIQGRNVSEKIAVTRMSHGTDINFGEIVKQLLFNKKINDTNLQLNLEHEVVDIKNDHNNWIVFIHDKNKKKQKIIRTRYIFVGSGGASLRLMQKSGIPEIKNYAGFPVGGQFLVSNNMHLINSHFAKVYGKASIDAPPMSVPHMDTRIINGHKTLLFGPFATFSSKFLKYGSWLDLFNALTIYNVIPILYVGLNNFKLIKYLINQLIMSRKDRINALRQFYPQAKIEDWSLIQAGQRVQIIKRHSKKYSVLKFGTEIVSSANGSLSALLGASPGASTSVSIIIKLLQVMFKEQFINKIWQNKLKNIIPSYGQKLNNNLVLLNYIRHYTCDTLELSNIPINSNAKIN